ncbi:MAG TPA: penicillin-binding transpeptidase domain-containing protein [Candidatus Acidoferrales bacterium]|nr:penicillin-binding transpeptidase domain-containing protein [Candidatus Acidoferrales bacterium]
MRRTFKNIKPRLAVVVLLFFGLFAALGLRAFHLQILNGEQLREKGARQHLKEWTLLPKRGSIWDRSGEVLAVSVEAQSVYARPRRLEDPENTARALARALGLHPAKVEREIKSARPFVWIKRQVTPKEAERVQALGIDGIGLSYEPTRYYPQGPLAGHVVGFVGRDSQGLEGVELQYDRYIRGETSSSVIERDALGRRVLIQGVEDIQIPPGADIHLTLDTSIQHLTEKELEAAVTKNRAKGGIALVVEPSTGEILALANYPSFNPNNFTAVSSERWRNRAITDSYEPGSTFKTILAAAALEEGAVGKEDLFYCEFGSYAYAGRTIHDTHKYGWIPFYRIIQYSSNIGATKIAEKLKKERFFKYIDRFGFGHLTEIDLPGESGGMVRPPERWAAIDLATHSFGQGIAVTPIQMAMAYAAIANGGFLMRPFTVRRVVGPDGKVLLENQPRVVRRVISESTARSLTSILKGVVSEGGTGTQASLEGFEVAGKTGTSQKPDPNHRGYSPNKRIASFIGFVPADKPAIVALVVIDEPEGSVYGGVVAAPAFQNIARGALRRLGVVPDRPEAVRAFSVAPDGAAYQQPKPQASASTEDSARVVPDFVGLSLRAALVKARALNIPVEVRGHGYVVKQSPAVGAAWEHGDKLILNLQG